MLNQIWTDDSYIYTATTSGLGIISTYDEQLLNFILYEDGITSVWSDGTLVYLGTTNSGIKYIDIASVEVAETLLDYRNNSFLTSEKINCLHGYSDRLVCCTAVGVDIIRLDPTQYISHTLLSGAVKCFAVPNEFYYTVLSGTTYSLCKIEEAPSDWVIPTSKYNTGAGFLADATSIVDFYVTYRTSISGIGNTIFLATTSGVYVYDEGIDSCIAFTTTASGAGKYPILREQNVNFLTSVWAEPNANINTSRLYVSSSGIGATFSVIDLNSKSIYDSYLVYEQGLLGDFLDQEDVVDINIVSL